VRQLAEILLDEGLVDQARLEEAYEEHDRTGASLGRVLVEQGALTEPQLVRALAEQIGLPFVDCPTTRRRLRGRARPRRGLPAAHRARDSATTRAACCWRWRTPRNVFALDDVRSMTGFEPRPVVATREDLLAAIDRFCRADGDLDDLGSVMSSGEDDEFDLAKVKQVVEDAPIVKYVNLLHHPGDPGPGAPTSTSSPASTTCGCATASTACCTR
jgi:type IV pilus assembly protein PilB